MNVPATLPYNPSSGSVRVLAVLPVIVFGVGTLLGFSALFVWLGAALTVAVPVGLGLRRTVWKRTLRVVEDRMEVPSGLLRMRTRVLQYEDVRTMRVIRLPLTAVLFIRTPSYTVEVQDIYLPKGVTLSELQDIIVSRAERRAVCLP